MQSSYMISNFDCNYQVYIDYSKWIARNDNYYANSLAYQDLNNQNYMQSLTIDLTVEEKTNELEIKEEKMEIIRPESPTQARDFKLFCEGCKRSFTSKKRLQNHLMKCLKKIKKGKTRAFSCRSCHKSFKKPSGLVKHSLKHHEEKNRIEEAAILPRRPSIFHSIDLLSVSDSPMRKWKELAFQVVRYL